MNKVWLLLFSFLVPFNCYPQAYLYPVATVPQADGSERVLVLYQESPTKLTLFTWDPVSKRAVPVIEGSYTPAGISSIPTTHDISFIDKGRIRIYKAGRARPASIALRAGLYNISSVHWIDALCGYVSAKRRDRYGIYQIDQEGHVATVASSITYDYLYPQKIGDHLFYIERSSSDNGFHHYEVVHTQYPVVHYPSNKRGSCIVLRTGAQIQNSEHTFNDAVTLQERMDAFITHHKDIPDQQEQTIVNFDNRPIMFLTMIAPDKGFVIEYPATCARNDAQLLCTYHYLECSHGEWGTRPLFNFKIPRSLLDNESSIRLYESFLPFIPRYYCGKVYFSDCSAAGILDIYSYDMERGMCERKTVATDNHNFCPLMVKNLIFYGVSREVIKTGEIKFDLPFFT